MQTVEYSHWLPYDPAQIFAFLTNSDSLASVVGRINRATVIEQKSEMEGRLAVELDLPARKVARTEGTVIGVLNESLSFETQEPFPLRFTWTLVPSSKNDTQGTRVDSTLSIDLSAFGLPGVGVMVRGIITGELEEDMKRLEAALAKS